MKKSIVRIGIRGKGRRGSAEAVGAVEREFQELDTRVAMIQALLPLGLKAEPVCATTSFLSSRMRATCSATSWGKTSSVAISASFWTGAWPAGSIQNRFSRNSSKVWFESDRRAK